jgi:N12 class adenine-specific DNA methylase
VAQAISDGSLAIDGELPPVLSLVDHHTPSGAVRMLVVGTDGRALVTVPLERYLRGDEISSVTIPLDETTLPRERPLFERPAGECLSAIAEAARSAVASIGADDAEAESLTTLAAAAGAGRYEEVSKLLQDPGISLLLGSPVEAFRLEVKRIFAQQARLKKPEETNWYFDRDSRVAPRSIEARTKANLAAVRLLKKLESEERLATPAEKAVLAQFSGWGSMKGVFDEQMAQRYAEAKTEYDEAQGTVWRYNSTTYRREEVKVSFAEYCGEYHTYEGVAEWHKRWGTVHQELKSLLGEEEFVRASLSSLNAHFTEESVCHRLWDIAKQLGFQGGTVLEPAVGSARIISAMPPELRDKCRVVAVEKDPSTAALAKHLIPEARVYAEGFESAPVKNATADLVITNVPFSDTRVGDSGLSLHNYFISQSMAKLKPGGLAVLITTAHTLDSSADQRARLTERAELVGAFRLPNDAFKNSAGTDVVTDVLMFRKPAHHLTPVGETFSSVLPVAVPEDQQPVIAADTHVAKDEIPTHALVNEFYIRHPEYVFGIHSLRGKMYGRGSAPQYTVAPAARDLSLDEQMAAAIEKLSPVENSSVARQQALTDEELEATRLAALKEEKVGSVVSRDGKLFQVDASRELVPWRAPEASQGDAAAVKRAAKMAQAFVQLRERFVALIAADLSPVTTDDESTLKRKALRDSYEAFREEFGPLNETRTRRTLKEAVGGDPDFYTVMALETVTAERVNKRRVLVCNPAKILSERTLFPSVAPQSAATLDEAALLSLAERGRMDLPYMARLLGREGEAGIATTREEALRDGIAFLDPTSGALEYREQYLTGDVIAKLDEARQAALEDPAFASNVAALEKAQPTSIAYEQIRPTIASAWLPAETVTAFARQVFSLNRHAKMVYDADDGWRPTGTGNRRHWDVAFDHSRELQEKFGSGSMSYLDVFQAAARGKSPTIYKEIEAGEGTKKVFDEVATREVEQRVIAIRDRFLEWLGEPAQAAERERVEGQYNRTMNRVVLAKWDGSRLRFPGLAHGSFVPMPHQRDAVMRMLLMLRGVIAHGVGFGKTLEIILAAMESKRLGLASKPMVVCDNANYEQMVATVRQCYPHARILHAEEGDMSPAKREEFKARVASGDHDLVLMSRSQFGRIRVTPEREIAYLIADLKQFDSLVEGDNRIVRQQLKAKEKAMEKAEERMQKLREKGGGGLFWEQLGVDLLLVDESHRHKKIGINTRFDGIKGIDTAMSQRGVDLLLKSQFLQERRGQGRGAIGFTGTPCSNTMAEYWTGVRIFDPENLRQFGVQTFDQFATAFAQTENSLELNESNGRWRVVERLKKFINGREFIRFIAATYDVRMDGTELGLKRPKHLNGNVELASCPLTRLVHQGKQEIANIYQHWEGMEPKERAQLSWIPLVLMQLNIALSIDPRLVDPEANAGKDALVYGMADEIAKIYHENNKPGEACTHTQVVFCDRRNPINGKIALRLSSDSPQADHLTKFLDDDTALEVDNSTLLVTEEEDEEESETPQRKAAAAAAPAQHAAAFNLWEEIRTQLVDRGIPRDKVAIISDCRNKSEKVELLDKMNTGEIAVLIGSSDTLGIGSNFQRRLFAAHHVDPARSMTPDAMEQRDGRIERQGNSHSFIRNIRYGMENTVIPAIYGRIQTKGSFAKQAFAKDVGVEFEETSDLRLEEMRAMLLTDKRAMDRQMLNEQIRNLKLDEEAALRRSGDLRRRVDNDRFAISYVSKRLPNLIGTRDWFRANVIAPSKAPTWKVSMEFRSPLKTEERTALKKSEVKIDASGVAVCEGSPEQVQKFLQRLIDAWKEESDFRHIGSMVLNGCPLKISTVQYGLSDSRRISADVYDPTELPSKDGKRCVYGSGMFMSVEKLLDTVEAVIDKAESAVGRDERELQRHQHELEQTLALVESLPKPDLTRRRELEQELSALEADMAANPFAGIAPPPRSAARCAMTFDAGKNAKRADAAAQVGEDRALGDSLTVSAAVLASGAPAQGRTKPVAPSRPENAGKRRG